MIIHLSDHHRALIRNRRVELGISVNALAKTLRVSQSLLARIEYGEREPSADLLRHLCAELGLALEVPEIKISLDRSQLTAF